MNKQYFLIVIGLFLLIFYSPVYSQDHSEHSEEAFKRHRISFIWGNTLVPAGKNAHNEDSEVFFPTWGLTYEYILSHRFAIGWVNELEMTSYAVEHGNEAILEREYPFISSIVLIYEPFKGVILHAGPGYEFERNESFFIMKMGADYIFLLPKDFDIGFGFSYDIKNNLYDAWTFGLTLGKRLGKRH